MSRKASPTRRPRRIPVRRTTADERAILVAGLNAQPLSTLLRIAVTDMRKARKAGRTLNMGIWVTRDGCACCMAGAVMCERVGTKSNSARYVGTINLMRGGVFDGAYNFLHSTKRVHELPDDQQQALALANQAVQRTIMPMLGRAPDRVYLRVARDLAAVGL